MTSLAVIAAHSYGRMLLREGRCNEAAKVYTRIQETYKAQKWFSVPTATFWRGVACCAAKDIKAAEAEWRKLAREEVTGKASLAHIAALFLGELDEAAFLAKFTDELPRNMNDHFFTIAEKFDFEGDAATAAYWYKKCIAISVSTCDWPCCLARRRLAALEAKRKE